MPFGRKVTITLMILIVLVLGLVPAIQGIVSTNSQAGDHRPHESTIQTNEDRVYDRVLFAGDSISVGRDAKLLPRSFRKLVAHRLTANGTKSITTVAKSGAKLAYISHRPKLPSNLDLAIIELGTNDVKGSTSSEEFNLEYQSYLERIQSTSPNVRIFCLGVWHDPKSKVTASLDRVIQRSCEQVGGTFISIADIFAQPQNRGPGGVSTWKGKSDRLHPNDAGHLAIAKKLLKKLSLPTN